MSKHDPACTVSNPRLLAAIYFGLLSVVGTLLIDAFLTSVGFEHVVPVFQAVVLGMIIASGTGALFGEQIIHCKKPYKAKTFFLGFIMVIASLPVFALGLMLLMERADPDLYSMAKFHDMVYIYLVILAYCYILFGIVLAIASGFAAMYLRGRLVYDILNSRSQGNKAMKQELAKTEKKEPPHPL